MGQVRTGVTSDSGHVDALPVAELTPLSPEDEVHDRSWRGPPIRDHGAPQSGIDLPAGYVRG